jgi:hypothetical protein
MCLLALNPASYAYPTRGFAIREFLNEADLVCHGKVLSVKSQAIEPDASFHPPLQTEGGIARVHVLNVIKGSKADEIEVVFRLSTNSVSYTQLEQGDECILFLNRQGNTYRFVDNHDGTLAIPPHIPLHYKSDSPANRLIEELVFATREDKGRIRLVCAEQLAHLAGDQAVNRLEELAHDDDVAVRGVAYAGLITLDRPPSARDVASFLAMTNGTRSLDRFQTTAYDNAHLKTGILYALQSRFGSISSDIQYSSANDGTRENPAWAAAQKWKEFDVIDVVTAVSYLEKDEYSWIGYRDIADIVRDQIDERGVPAFIDNTYRKGSRTVVSGLLNNGNQEVRFTAARAIDRMIHIPHQFPYPQLRDWEAGGKEQIDKYVTACRDWVTVHKEWMTEDQ